MSTDPSRRRKPKPASRVFLIKGQSAAADEGAYIQKRSRLSDEQIAWQKRRKRLADAEDARELAASVKEVWE